MMIIEIDQMDIASIDLNLLVAFDVLLREQNVTKAGRRMGLSQPAMSNILSRLRQLLDDPVLVRSSSGMVPTPRALELAEPIRQSLAGLDAALSTASFEPATAELSFKIAGTDHTAAVLLPELVRRLQDRAPGIDIDLSNWQGAATFGDVASGGIDLAVGIGPLGDVPAGVHKRNLFLECFVCLVRRDHPVVKNELTLAQYVNLSHVLVSPHGSGRSTRGIVDDVLAKQGLQRRVAVSVPHFAAAPVIVSQTDMIVTLSKSLALPFAEALDLQIFSPPVELTTGHWYMIWHERTHRSQAHRWLRDQISDLSKGLGNECSEHTAS